MIYHIYDLLYIMIYIYISVLFLWRILTNKKSVSFKDRAPHDQERSPEDLSIIYPIYEILVLQSIDLETSIVHQSKVVAELPQIIRFLRTRPFPVL